MNMRKTFRWQWITDTDALGPSVISDRAIYKSYSAIIGFRVPKHKRHIRLDVLESTADT